MLTIWTPDRSKNHSPDASVIMLRFIGMKLQNAILLIFVALLVLLVLTKIVPTLALAGMALVPVLVIWQVIIALRHKEPAKQDAAFDEQWYENP